MIAEQVFALRTQATSKEIFYANDCQEQLYN